MVINRIGGKCIFTQKPIYAKKFRAFFGSGNGRNAVATNIRREPFAILGVCEAIGRKLFDTPEGYGTVFNCHI